MDVEENNDWNLEDSQENALPPYAYHEYLNIAEENLSDYIEIEIYDDNLTCEENFENWQGPKYILIRVERDGWMFIEDMERSEPSVTSFDKIMVNKHLNYTFDSHMIDYDTIFGTRLLNFMKYDSNFFSCDERVFFEALLIKYKKSDYTTFYWSKNRIFNELGIKKDRADKIINKFKTLGFLTTEKKTRQFEGKPQQVTYFILHPSKIIELLPSIFLETAEFNFDTHRDVIKYLKPGLNRSKKLKK